jgi:hypothetical protein
VDLYGCSAYPVPVLAQPTGPLAWRAQRRKMEWKTRRMGGDGAGPTDRHYDPCTSGTGDGNRRGAVRGGLNDSAWAEKRAVGKSYAGFLGLIVMSH